MAQSRVLLVEDDPDIRRMFDLFLRDAGFVVKEAKDGLEAIALLQLESFDAIVLDLSMPRVDGMSALDTFQLMPHGLNIPIIAVTALDDPAVKQRALEAGAVEFLRKPLPPQRLIDALNQHIKPRDE